MVLILLEALGALALLVFIVWWTMFSGRKNGERTDGSDDGSDDDDGAGSGSGSADGGESGAGRASPKLSDD
jgi:hypothetical protein